MRYQQEKRSKYKSTVRGNLPCRSLPDISQIGNQAQLFQMDAVNPEFYGSETVIQGVFETDPPELTYAVGKNDPKRLFMMYFQNFVGDISGVIAKNFGGFKGTVEEAFKNVDGFVRICMAELGPKYIAATKIPPETAEIALRQIYEELKNTSIGLIAEIDPGQGRPAALVETLTGIHFSQMMGYQAPRRGGGADFEANRAEEDGTFGQAFDPFGSPAKLRPFSPKGEADPKRRAHPDWKAWMSDTYEVHASGRKGGGTDMGLDFGGFGMGFGMEDEASSSSATPQITVEPEHDEEESVKIEEPILGKADLIDRETKGVLDLTYMVLEDLEHLSAFFHRMIDEKSKLIAESAAANGGQLMDIPEEAAYLLRTHAVFLNILPPEAMVQLPENPAEQAKKAEIANGLIMELDGFRRYVKSVMPSAPPPAEEE